MSLNVIKDTNFGAGLLSGLSQVLSQRKQREFDQAEKDRTQLLNLVIAALPNLEDPAQIAPILQQVFEGGSGKGRGKKGQPSVTDHVMNVLTAGHQVSAPASEEALAGAVPPVAGTPSAGASVSNAPAGAAPAGLSDIFANLKFLTPQRKAEIQAKVEADQERAEYEMKVERARKMAAEFNIPLTDALDRVGFKGQPVFRQSAPKVIGKPIGAADAAKSGGVMVDGSPIDPQTKGLLQPVAVQNEQGGWDVRYQAAPAPPRPRLSAKLQARVEQSLGAKGITDATDDQWAEAVRVASAELQNEQRTVFNQLLKLRNQRIDMNDERYQEMLELFPLTMQAKRLGIETADARLEDLGQTDPTKLSEWALRTAATMVTQKNSPYEGEDLLEVRNGLLRELGWTPERLQAAIVERQNRPATRDAGGGAASGRLDLTKAAADYLRPLLKGAEPTPDQIAALLKNPENKKKLEAWIASQKPKK